MENARKILIHIRTPKKARDTHAHKKVRAHLHTHEHDAVRAKQKAAQHARELTIKHAHTQPSATLPHLGSQILNKLSIPRKPVVVEDIAMSTLKVAYFCMEMGVENAIPTYAGGLGILAGDMLRSCADLKLPAIGVSLLYRGGYFRQRFDASGWQMEEEESWNPSAHLIALPQEVVVPIEGRDVRVRAWLYKMEGYDGHINPVMFLDTDVPGNTPEDRQITRKLYSGDRRHRLTQEAILGIGGMRMLQKIGATHIEKFHMNESHSALLILELYRAYASYDQPIEEVRRHAVFTTHTPTAVGHEYYEQDFALAVLGVHAVPRAIEHLVFAGGGLNMTRLGLEFSQFINGVAMRHGEVTRELFPGYNIESITNGVHAGVWVAPPLVRLYDTYIPEWRLDAYSLRYVLSIPAEELWYAHQESKMRLFEHIAVATNVRLDPDLITIGFARRATAYKRGNMLFRDIGRLARIAEKSKGIQIIYAGKAHPDDREGKLLLQEIIRNLHVSSPKITCVFLENYDIELAKLLVSGVDLWLNTPARPQEASGTSGMKAALNGVPHFSTLDGWWLEGHIEHVTGFSIGPHPEDSKNWDADAEDAEDLYRKLEHVIIPRFEGDRHSWIKMMRSTIAVNGAFFNTQRMVEQYNLGAYLK